MKGATILFSEMTPEFDWEERFNKWYNSHYIPIRMTVPGFLSAQRYKDADRADYLAIYELDSDAALETNEYRQIREFPNIETRQVLDNVSGRARYVGDETHDLRQKGLKSDPLDAPIIYVSFFSVPDEAAKEFDGWYTEEHVPQLLKCKDWLACRRFLITEGDPQPWTHLAIHYLNDMSAFDSPEREVARTSETRKRLAEEPWFNASTLVLEQWGDRFPHADG